MSKINKLIGIYCWINKINNKVYVGSSTELTERFVQHFLGSSSNASLQKDIDKYGIENFLFCIIEFLNLEFNKLSIEEIKKIIISREQYYLDEICLAKDPSTWFYKNTYNRNRLAYSNLGTKWSKESKKKKSKVQMGRKLTQEWIDNIKKNHASKKEGYIPPRKGVKLTESDWEHLRKMIKNLQIPVLQYDIYGNFIKEYESQVIAAKELGINSTNISKCTNGRIKSAGGFLWLKKNSDDIQVKITTNTPTLIKVYDIDMNFIGKYKNINEIFKKLKICRQTIKNALNRGGYSTNNYFEYEK